MDKNSGTNAGSKRARARRKPVFMAYTLNNTQPVICTLVADQPYFYMEDESVAEDDDILGFEEYENFEKDMADLKKKMDAFESLSRQYERAPGRRIEEFAAEAITLCEQKQGSLTSVLQPADNIISVLSQSRMAKSLIDFALNSSVYVVESDQVDGACYDALSGQIMVHPALAIEEQCLLAVRELRRHWQHRKGAMIHPLTFHPDQAVVINRAQIADLTTSMIRVCWELQLAGQRNFWEFIENSSLADLGRAFAREAFVDFRALANGKAAAAVFESWFLSDRCRHQDKKLIQSMLADHQGYVFSDAHASRSVSIELISALGEQPFGKNYLAPFARMIIEDPVFTEVRDRSNANFLWFIKFERSFKETEQALQSGEDLLEGDILSASTTPQKDSKTHGHNPHIIPLHADRQEVIHKTDRRLPAALLEDAAPRTNVIHVRFGEGKSL